MSTPISQLGVATSDDSITNQRVQRVTIQRCTRYTPLQLRDTLPVSTTHYRVVLRKSAPPKSMFTVPILV